MSVRQLPSPQQGSIQGPTVQPWFIYPTNQPEQISYFITTSRNRFIVDAPPQIHQGATRMQTFPIPPVFQLDPAWLPPYFFRDVNRILAGAGPIHQLDGATKMRTDPIPPVTTRPDRYFGPFDANQRQDANDLVKIAHLDGPTKLQTHPVPPVVAVELTQFEKIRQTLRYIVPTVPRFEGPTTLSTDPIPPVSKPEMRYYVPDINRYDAGMNMGPELQYDGATKLRTDPIPPVSEPLFNYYTPSINRYIDEIVKRFEGATTLGTSPIPPVSAPELSWWIISNQREINRLLAGIGPTKQTDGSTLQPTFIFPPNQPELTAFERLRQGWRYLVEAKARYEGAIVQSAEPIVPVSLPSGHWYERLRHSLRFIVGASPRFEGATQQDWFIYPNSNPVFAYYVLNQARTDDAMVGPTAQYDGPTKQATFIFPLSQPQNYIPIQNQARHSAFIDIMADIFAFVTQQPRRHAPAPQQPQPTKLIDVATDFIHDSLQDVANLVSGIINRMPVRARVEEMRAYVTLINEIGIKLRMTVLQTIYDATHILRLKFRNLSIAILPKTTTLREAPPSQIFSQENGPTSLQP